VTNRKAPARRGKVQLIDATSFWTPMRKSLGDKRREIPPEKAVEILAIHGAFAEGEHSKIFPTTHFGYRKITVERPLRLNFQASAERIARLDVEAAFRNLAVSKKKPGSKAAADEEAAGRAEQEAVRAMLEALPDRLYKNRPDFVAALDAAAAKTGLKLAAPVRKAILSAVCERDETAEVCSDADGNPEPDPELRDYESVPLGENIEEYFAREVTPHVPDAWINTAVRDEKDGQVGKVGYEFNFNRYFYKYMPPRALDEIEREIRQIESEIANALRVHTDAPG